MGVPQVTFRDTRVRDGDLARSVCADVCGPGFDLLLRKAVLIR